MGREALVKPQVLAQQFLDDHRDKPIVRWRGKWYEWTGTHYRACPPEGFESELYRWLVEQFSQLPGNPPVTTSRHRDVLHVIRSMTFMPGDLEAPFSLLTKETRPATITFQNGVLDVVSVLSGGTAPLRAHTPHWFSTVALPFNYDPHAKAPRWEEFVQQVFEGDTERIRFWHEWMGYCCIQSYQFQHAVILVGEGRNGKGVCLRTLEHLLGTENVSHVPLDLFGDRFQLLPTMGKLANVAGEISGSSKAAEEYLKMYTGGDPIYVDVKGKEGVDIKPTARLIFACNEIPPFVDRSDGIRRRLVIVPFNWQVPPSQVDRDLEGKLCGELPGIFNLAMLGLRDLLERGEFQVPQLSKEATSQHLLESNSARLFLTENTFIQRDTDTPTARLYESYVEFCRLNRLNPVLNNIQFGGEVSRHYGPLVERKQRRVGNVKQNVYRHLGEGTPPTETLPMQ